MEKDRKAQNLFMERLRKQLREREAEVAFNRADPAQAREEFWDRTVDVEYAERLAAIEGGEPGPRESTQGVLMDMIEENWAVDDDLLAEAAQFDPSVDQFMLRQYRDEREIGHLMEPRWETLSAQIEREAAEAEEREVERDADSVMDALEREGADDWEIGD